MAPRNRCVAMFTIAANGMLPLCETTLPARPAYALALPPTTFPNVRLTPKLATAPPTYSTDITQHYCANRYEGSQSSRLQDEN